VLTADEAWEFIPGHEAESVHLAPWRPVKFSVPEAEERKWKKLFDARERILPHLEKERQAKRIGKALEAKVTLSSLPDADRETLRELLNVSQLAAAQNGEADDFTVTVTKADGQKCEEDVGANSEHPTLCGRCVAAVQTTAAPA
jgi:isoleucyl-tRNA synthetase